MTSATLLLLVLSVRPLFSIVQGWFGKGDGCGCGTGSCDTGVGHSHIHIADEATDCACGESCQTSDPVHIQPKAVMHKKKKGMNPPLTILPMAKPVPEGAGSFCLPPADQRNSREEKSK